MSSVLDDYGELASEVEGLKRTLERQAGRYEELMNTLKNDFKLTSVADAKKELEKVQSKIENLDTEGNKLINEIDTILDTIDKGIAR